MKRLFLTITIGLCSLLLAQTLFAQDQIVPDQPNALRERIAKKQGQQSGTSGERPLTVRAQIMNESQTQEIDNVPWMREILRFIDLEKEKNATLYYPVNPIGDRMNLFTLIFKHFQNGDINVYKYKLDGSENFNEENKENFKDILESFEIMNKQENGKYIIQDVDIPSNQVLGYYVKEAWYFDKNNSVVDIKTLALCPIMMRQDDFGVGSSRYPMFWVPYENIRPYTSRMPIMVSSLNNATTMTINDYFTKHLFEGEIEKATNVRNMSLGQLYPDNPKGKKEAQKKIEGQLKTFNENLWVYNDSIVANGATVQANNKGKGPSIKGAPTPSSTTSTTRAEVQKEAKSQSASPAKSMRNRKRN